MVPFNFDQTYMSNIPKSSRLMAVEDSDSMFVPMEDPFNPEKRTFPPEQEDAVAHQSEKDGLFTVSSNSLSTTFITAVTSCSDPKAVNNVQSAKHSALSMARPQANLSTTNKPRGSMSGSRNSGLFKKKDDALVASSKRKIIPRASSVANDENKLPPKIGAKSIHSTPTKKVIGRNDSSSTDNSTPTKFSTKGNDNASSPNKSRPRWYTDEYVRRVKPTKEEIAAQRKGRHLPEEFYVRPKRPWALFPLDISNQAEINVATGVKWQEIIAAKKQPLPSGIDLAKFWSLKKPEFERNIDANYANGTRPGRADLTFSKLPVTGTGRMRSSKDSSRHRTSDAEVEVITPTSSAIKNPAPPRVRTKYTGGNDHSWMNRSAGEVLNDSKLVKGIGYVPINRVSVVEEPDDNKPFALPPDSDALKFHSGDVSRYLSRKEMHGADDDLSFQWMGSAGKLVIYKGPDIIAKIKFKGIKTVKYRPYPQEDFLITAEDDRLEFLFTTSMTQVGWARLKRFFYLITDVKPGQKSCDMPLDGNFWVKKIAALEKEHHKDPADTHPQYAYRRSDIKPIVLTKKQSKLNLVEATKNDPASILRKRPNLFRRIRTMPNKAASSTNTMMPAQNTFGPDSESEGESEAIMAAPALTNPSVPTVTGDSPTGLYYKLTEFPVHVGDQVVRIRSAESITRGKRDEFDLFDGPWRIRRFFTRGTFAIAAEDINNKDAWTKMLTTKVELNFPKGTSATTKWVALGQLLPVMDATNIISSEIHASNASIAKLQNFQRLRSSASDVDSADHELRMSAAGSSQQDGLGLVQFKKGEYVAVMEVNPDSGNDAWEVEKLRHKRLRRYYPKDPIVKENEWVTDKDDPWVKRYLANISGSKIKDEVIVTEFFVHWAGWPDVDDCWTPGTGNITQACQDDYNITTDPLREFPIDKKLKDVEELFAEEDQVGPQSKSKKRKRRNSQKPVNASKKVSGQHERHTSPELAESDDDANASQSVYQDELDVRQVLKAFLEDEDLEDVNLRLALEASLNDLKRPSAFTSGLVTNNSGSQRLADEVSTQNALLKFQAEIGVKEKTCGEEDGNAYVEEDFNDFEEDDDDQLDHRDAVNLFVIHDE